MSGQGNVRRYYRFLLAAVVLCYAVPGAAQAGAVEDRAQLKSCADKHMTPEDTQTARRMFFFMITDAFATGDGGAQAVTSADKKESAAADIAALITRIAEKDCVSEMKTFLAGKPPQGAFAPIFESITVRATSSFEPAMTKVGIAWGLDIIKKLDPVTVVDIGVGQGGASHALDSAPPKSGNTHWTKTAVAGVKLRLTFETSLNPDCSAMGNTVIRVVNKPAHGSTQVESTKDFTNFESTNQRYRCNEHRTAGTALYFTPARDYSGPDSLSFEVIFPTGNTRKIDVDLTVN